MENDGIVADKPYDEAINLGESDDDDVSTPDDSGSEAGDTGMSPKQMGASAGAPSSQASPAAPQRQQQATREEESSSDGSGESESSTSDEETENTGGAGGALPANAYNPDEFKNMKVSPEIEELFQYIARYKPHTIELDTSLKPFIPDMIPCIGEVDAFLKIPAPAGAPSTLGLNRLDEPCLNSSDPSILDLQLRTLSKHQNLQPVEVRSIEDAEKNPKEIENWMKRIEDLNRSKPAPNVQYSRKMPDIEQLMQVWPAEFEDFLSQNQLPGLADLDMDLLSYIKLMASILDVPVYEQVTDSLHVIFTLFSEFKLNQHFASLPDTSAVGRGADPYSYDFGPQSFGGPSGFQASESHAPSRAPSPVQMGHM